MFLLLLTFCFYILQISLVLTHYENSWSYARRILKIFTSFIYVVMTAWIMWVCRNDYPYTVKVPIYAISYAAFVCSVRVPFIKKYVSLTLLNMNYVYPLL